MSKFTLFNSLLKNTESFCSNGKCKDISKLEKEYFIDKVKNVEVDTQELIYAIISAYSPACMDTSIPFSGVFVESGVVQFNYNTFPPRLKRMLYNFLQMHIRSLGED